MGSCNRDSTCTRNSCSNSKGGCSSCCGSGGCCGVNKAACKAAQKSCLSKCSSITKKCSAQAAKAKKLASDTESCCSTCAESCNVYYAKSSSKSNDISQNGYSADEYGAKTTEELKTEIEQKIENQTSTINFINTKISNSATTAGWNSASTIYSEIQKEISQDETNFLNSIEE